MSSRGVHGGHFGIHDVKDNDAKCKFYTGLTWDQFVCVRNYLGSAKDKVCYWNQQLKTGDKSPSKRPGVRRKLSPLNEFFLTMVRLRVGLLNKDLAYRFGISPSSVSKIVTSWIQFLHLQFGRMRNVMFASRQLLKHNMPSCFAKFKGIRVIIDCCGFLWSSPRTSVDRVTCILVIRTTQNLVVSLAFHQMEVSCSSQMPLRVLRQTMIL